MRLLSLIESIVLESRQEEILRKEYVETGKVSEDTFNQILSTYPSGFQNKWLLHKVANGIIKDEDVYKFKEYFDIHKKNPAKFDIPDLGQVKTAQQVRDFVEKAISIIEAGLASTGGSQISKEDAANLVSANDIDKLKAVGINFLGLVDGYQVFEIPMELRGNETAFNVYKNVLAKCANRDQGASIRICTMASQNYFDSYLKDGPYFVFFNLGDPLSPYQFHYESNQFMDKNDRQLI